MLNLFNSALLSTVETAINRLISLDSASRNRLAELTGVNVRVECTNPPFTLSILAHEHGLLLSSRGEGEADVSLRGSASALLDLLLAGSQVPGLQGRNIEVRGDLEKAMRLQHLLAGLRFDWEYHLGKLLGDVPTQMLGDTLRSGQELLRTNSRSILLDIDEYLHEETNLLPGKTELEAFYSSLHALRLNVDRLAARVERLDAELPDQPPSP